MTPQTAATQRKDKASIWLEPELMALADGLIPRIAARPEMRAFRVSRTAVLRLAIIRGLEALDAEIDAPATPSLRIAQVRRSKTDQESAGAKPARKGKEA